jgi:hypothetical protein
MSQQIEESEEEKIPYTDSGYVVYARKWLGCFRKLAAYPSAFVVYFHLLAWANHANGQLKRGQLALGERHFAELLGMSVTTLRKWLRWLRDEGWIKLEPTRHGKERGTIVTVLHYEVSQAYSTYALRPDEQERVLMTIPLPKKDGFAGLAAGVGNLPAGVH